MDLYETLGVSKDADDAALRKGYRKVAKKAHPDAGGSTEAFEKVSQALAVLLNPAKREHYDKTGKIEEPPVDNKMAEATNIVAGVLDAVQAQVERKGFAPATVDLIKAAVAEIDVSRKQQEQRVRETNAAAKKACALAKRFHVVEGKADRIGPMLEAKAANLERAAEDAQAAIEQMKLAISILNDHTFDVEEIDPIVEMMRTSRAKAGW
jgi:curved DNA-binding protein CbpA